LSKLPNTVQAQDRTLVKLSELDFTLKRHPTNTMI